MRPIRVSGLRSDARAHRCALRFGAHPSFVLAYPGRRVGEVGRVLQQLGKQVDQVLGGTAVHGYPAVLGERGDRGTGEAQQPGEPGIDTHAVEAVGHGELARVTH